MDTERNIPVNSIENFETIYLPDLTDDERSMFKNYVSLTRDIIESKQLFDVFYFNLTNMRNCFVFNLNDTVLRTRNCPNYANDYIAVNTFVMNLISSAKTLTEFLRRSASEWLENGDTKADEYNTYASSIYDSHLDYLIFTNLRNYIQHGYLPVSFQEGRYSFDVHQILDTQHISFNAKFKEELKKFIKNTEIPGETIPCISLTYTIANFTVEVIDLYKKFLSIFKKKIISDYHEIDKLIKAKPSIICDYHKDFIGHVFYEDDEYHRYHSFDTRVKPNNMVDEAIKKVTIIYNDEKYKLNKLKKIVEQS